MPTNHYECQQCKKPCDVKLSEGYPPLIVSTCCMVKTVIRSGKDW